VQPLLANTLTGNDNLRKTFFDRRWGLPVDGGHREINRYDVARVRACSCYGPRFSAARRLLVHPKSNCGAEFRPCSRSGRYASVYIGRPFGSGTSIFSLPVQIDGKPLISLAPNQYTTVELSFGPHSIGVPDEAWTRAIAGIPHPVELAAESGKTYYLLPSRRFEDAGYKFSPVGSVVVPERTAVTHSSFSVQTAGVNAAPPAEFSQLAYVKAP
jgi:hypothetical protein